MFARRISSIRFEIDLDHIGEDDDEKFPSDRNDVDDSSNAFPLIEFRSAMELESLLFSHWFFLIVSKKIENKCTVQTNDDCFSSRWLVEE